MIHTAQSIIKKDGVLVHAIQQSPVKLKEANEMLETQNIQRLLALTGEIMPQWAIIPERQTESRFPYHKQFIHLSTVCNMLVKDSLRNRFLIFCNSKTLFYLHENFTYCSCGEWERVEKTEWAKEALLNRSCTQSCTDCPELSKGRRRVKIECRLRDY